MISDSNGDVYFAGYFRQDADLNPNAGTDNYSIGTNQNTFLIKLAWDGAFVWAKTFENGCNSPAALDMDENEDLYILGGYSYTSDFDPGIGIANHTGVYNFNDIFVVKLDSDGIYQSSFALGGINEDNGQSIAVMNSDEYYIAGYFYNPIDFNPGAGVNTLTSNGDADIFVAKFGTCNVDVSVSTSGIILTANQSGATYQWMDC